jgi:hypothetical protein
MYSAANSDDGIGRRLCEVNSCPELLPVVEASRLDPVQDMRRFEDELATQFAGSTECNSVQFVYYAGPGESSKTAIDAMRKPK